MRAWWLTWYWLTSKMHLIRLNIIYYWKSWALLVPQIILLVCSNHTWYLSNRLFRGNLENCYSDLCNTTCAVLRGSILVPLLFVICVNDMLQAVKSNLLLYADESCFVFQQKDVIEIEKQLNGDSKNICEWFVENH